MKFKDLADLRYSIRKFKDDEISDELIKELVTVACKAPTSQNDQPQRLFIIKSKDSKEKLLKSVGEGYNAPLYIALAYDENLTRKRKYKGIDGGTVSTSIFATYLMLEATDKGLGSIWIGDFDLEKFHNLFELEDNIVPIGLIAIGYPDEKSKPSKQHTDREEFDEIAKIL